MLRIPIRCVCGVVAALMVSDRLQAADAPPATLEARTALAELSQAVKIADEAIVPLDTVNRLRQWDALLASSQGVQRAIQAALLNTDQSVALLREKAEKYRSDRNKAGILTSRIEALQAQADSFALLDAELSKAIKTLGARLEKIRADPEVQETLQALRAIEQSDAALGNASNAVPDLLKQ